jgi:membrane-associated phospholipid phosphatase
VIATAFERAIVAAVAMLVILGFYEVYFITQRVTHSRQRSLETVLDRYFKYRPGWVWIYTIFYYAVIMSLVATLGTYAEFVMTTASYLLLLLIQISIFASVPVSTPGNWRRREAPRSASERLLQFVQRIDAPSNCFPSMHTSVAVLTALHIHHNTSTPLVVVATYPVLIALSALFTKQHFVADVIVALPIGIVPFLWYLHVV